MICGNSPGVMKLLNPGWIIFILCLFNFIFQSARMPIAWTISKLIVLFKKGSRSNCGNFRGIAITDILYRLFDKILAARLTLWYKPCYEQAGAQKGRNCLEHIMTLRLLIDYAKKSRLKLYILFIDFEKAYDKVVRTKLIEELKSLGCGGVMLNAIIAIYKCTKLLFKGIAISANIGVKQGASTSCLLFILYVDRMIKMIKNSFQNDGFLGSIHILMLMDDTVLLSTTKECLVRKFQTCQQFCQEFGMTINELKTKFMVINHDENDQEVIVSGSITVKYCSSYMYLGTPITDDGSYNTIIQIHTREKIKHMLKFFSFISRNPDVPYMIKMKVAEACVFSSILYGSETWFTYNYGKLESMYFKILKSVLGVRGTTCNDLILFETGMGSLRSIVENRMRNFVTAKMSTLSEDEPLNKALILATQINTKSSKMIKKLLSESDDIKVRDLQTRSEKLKKNLSSKRTTYLTINPRLDKIKIYNSNQIREQKRVMVSRFRLSAHRLRVETGRWKRIPREERTCDCSSAIQDENHVVFNCGLSQTIRCKYKMNYTCFSDLFENMPANTIGDFFYELLQIYE
jgi:hypothetical protein